MLVNVPVVAQAGFQAYVTLYTRIEITQCDAIIGVASDDALCGVLCRPRVLTVMMVKGSIHYMFELYRYLYE